MTLELALKSELFFLILLDLTWSGAGISDRNGGGQSYNASCESFLDVAAFSVLDLENEDSSVENEGSFVDSWWFLWQLSIDDVGGGEQKWWILY